MPVAVTGKITALLTSLTSTQVGAMTPADRQQLANECERVLRLTKVERIVDDARKATFFEELRDGRGRE